MVAVEEGQFLKASIINQISTNKHKDKETMQEPKLRTGVGCHRLMDFW